MSKNSGRGYTYYRRYLLGLAAVFMVEWTVLAIHPKHRTDWILENILVVILAIGLVFSYRHLLFSRLSYTMIFLFLALHEIGAHYTYSEVPYDAWFERLTGHSFNALMGWERNHYDRLMHFLYGLLLAYPMRSVYLRVANVRGFWGYSLPLSFIMATSMVYELIEWGAALLFGGPLAQDYVGSQGDVWDAQKDMALAALGAFITIVCTGVINKIRRRDFAREWAESLRVKRKAPL
ncbi:MAG: DUF2238 domain-containing protein [Methylosarcina sp.]